MTARQEQIRSIARQASAHLAGNGWNGYRAAVEQEVVRYISVEEEEQLGPGRFARLVRDAVAATVVDVQRRHLSVGSR